MRLHTREPPIANVTTQDGAGSVCRAESHNHARLMLDSPTGKLDALNDESQKRRL